MDQRKNTENRKDVSFYIVLLFRVGREIDVLSDQGNVHTKGDINTYSSEVWKCSFSYMPVGILLWPPSYPNINLSSKISISILFY